jgi:hypothetical protein
MATIIPTSSRAPQWQSAKKADIFLVLNLWLTWPQPAIRTKKRTISWSEWQDSNLRPLRPERSALPG